LIVADDIGFAGASATSFGCDQVQIEAHAKAR